LENGRSKEDKISRGMWTAVETKAEEVRMAEAEGGIKKETRGK